MKYEELRAGFESAYIDGNLAVNSDYLPYFVSNNPAEGKKVIATIEDELRKCESFDISVAFITMGGITPLLQTLKELEARGVPGRILTTNYLNFSEPKALKKLSELNNVEIRMYDSSDDKDGFHTKGYIFKSEEIYRIIIGSSNLTRTALTTNKEWNTKIISTEKGSVTKAIVEEFNELWNSKNTLTFSDFYEVYEERYRIIEEQRRIAKLDKAPSFKKYKLEPNSMQTRFIVNLKKILDAEKDRALLISATGEKVIVGQGR